MKFIKTNGSAYVNVDCIKYLHIQKYEDKYFITAYFTYQSDIMMDSVCLKNGFDTKQHAQEWLDNFMKENGLA
jgi:hypothetical protein